MRDLPLTYPALKVEWNSPSIHFQIDVKGELHDFEANQEVTLNFIEACFMSMEVLQAPCSFEVMG